MIGAYLKHYMKSNGIEQVSISEKTGICPQVLGHYKGIRGTESVEQDRAWCSGCKRGCSDVKNKIFWNRNSYNKNGACHHDMPFVGV